jgi:hypothetical protein
MSGRDGQSGMASGPRSLSAPLGGGVLRGEPRIRVAVVFLGVQKGHSARDGRSNARVDRERWSGEAAEVSPRRPPGRFRPSPMAWQHRPPDQWPDTTTGLDEGAQDEAPMIGMDSLHLQARSHQAPPPGSARVKGRGDAPDLSTRESDRGYAYCSDRARRKRRRQIVDRRIGSRKLAHGPGTSSSVTFWA